MKEIFKIIPFKSVGKLFFGMNTVEIENIYGNPIDVVEDAILGEKRLIFKLFIAVFIRNKLVEVYFKESNFHEIHVMIDEINIIGNNKIIEELSQNKKAKPSVFVKGNINFYGYGINLGGFKKTTYYTEKEIIVFSKGRLKFFQDYYLTS